MSLEALLVDCIRSSHHGQDCEGSLIVRHEFFSPILMSRLWQNSCMKVLWIVAAPFWWATGAVGGFSFKSKTSAPLFVPCHVWKSSFETLPREQLVQLGEFPQGWWTYAWPSTSPGWWTYLSNNPQPKRWHCPCQVGPGEKLLAFRSQPQLRARLV